MATISFDFDSTLDAVEMQDFAKQVKALGHKVVITTARLDNFQSSHPEDNEAVYAVASDIGISEINFTNLKDKVEFFTGKSEYLLHIDDSKSEVKYMNEEKSCKTHAFLWWEFEDWRERILKFIEENDS